MTTGLNQNVVVIGKEVVQTTVDTIINSERREYHRAYRKKNAKILAKKKHEYYTRMKHEGIGHYGGKCECCGESIKEFLTLEHKNGRDKDKKKLTGKKMWCRAKSEGYPDGYTVLCFNCNCSKGAYGTCPHKLKEKER